MKIVVAAAVCVVLVVGFIHFLKPTLMYREDGRLREFGVGWRNKTILPLWLAVFIVAVFSYAACCLYIQE